MNKFQRIAKNTIFLFVSQIISYLLALLFIIYVARYLGVSGFGTLSFAISFAGIFSIFTDLGLNMLMVREVSKDHSLKGKYLSNIILIKIMLVSVTFALIILLMNLSRYPNITVLVVYIIAVSTMIYVFTEIFYFFFQTFEKMEFQSIGNVMLNSLLIFGALLAIYKGMNIISFAYIYLISNTILFIYAISIFFWKFRIKELEIDLNFWKPTIKTALPISLFVISTTVIFRADSVILSFIQGNTVLGLYTASYKLMEALMIIPIVFMSALYPVISKLYVSSKNFLIKSFELSFKYLLILGIPIATGTTLLSKEIITALYGVGFNSSILILQILIWTIPVFYITYIMKNMLIIINKQNLASKIIFICMIFNLVLNIVLIPYFSYLAAAIVNVSTEIIFLLIAIHYMKGYFNSIYLKKLSLNIFLACFAMSIFLYIVEINFIIKIVISAIIYFFILFILKTFSEEDKYLLREVLRKK